jgi:hypothetical protein
VAAVRLRDSDLATIWEGIVAAYEERGLSVPRHVRGVYTLMLAYLSWVQRRAWRAT